MRPVVSTGKAWCCTVLSAFGVVILSVIAHLFNTNHESFVGSINDPEDGPAYVIFSYLFRRYPFTISYISPPY
ncbi:hypothetical protein SCEN_P04630 [Saccharomyces cerevisiae]|uniref:Putative uncharacterized protein YPR169W-A n=2 Tax=Saccharomyces cerevisiae TaxID=4932 RepID=YP169_YEAST|nr:RecName: Full=Putative uncharacterized protein YPR169W-A [Saccharomyces cerevisiae S288C]EWG88274.1 hypothetical protein P301_P21771 [Saccharomyces cerevisiae P301]KZV07684.1 hypothetical protein WN66_06734 [Saccharomyces cerevisiae]QHB12418.1 hypothetical protein SCEN_P04630 [Saccharomyces cerevisiae]CAY87128.1 EC1118_1P2_5127p [Saccharomyces cerevisiae EC1118]